jgi:serine/threonine protein kinase/Tol biopolymer transport system component
MSTERWQSLERIFAEARRLPAEARAAFVASLDHTDDALRREVLRLLAADAATDDFLAQPAFHRLAESIASEGWSLHAGQRLGPYTVLHRLGAGGAGEVWRAKDERLGRDVAIKVLLPHSSNDADRVRRFSDEARTASALNHPNILTIHDVGEHDGTPFVVSECLEGHSLRHRIDAGPVPADEAVAIALAIARGLGAAHACGIVHRDLKPENVFLRSDGGVKILDFGLAKLQSGLEGMRGEATHTLSGVILGTAAYMAPEQIKNELVDARADLFAVGVMLYEMLGASHPFRRASTFETLHALLTIDPPDVATAGSEVPRHLARIVMRLLKKAPEARFQSAIDLVWALEQLASGETVRPSEAAPLGASTPWWQSRAVGWIAASALTAGVLFGVWQLRSASPRVVNRMPMTQFTMSLPAGVSLASAPAVSPGGRHIAFSGSDGTSNRLFVRALESQEAVIIPGTEGATRPFWSADGTSIGFFAQGQLKTIAWPRGAPVAIAAAPQPYGGTWNASGTILFAPDIILTGVSRVPAAGGVAEPSTLVYCALGDTSHWWPVFLSDGLHFLYHVRSTQDDRLGVYLGRLDRPGSPAGSLLLRSNSDVVYVPLPGTADGVLLYVVDGRIEARRFDSARGTVAADAQTLGLSAAGSTLYDPVMLSASPDVLAFAESSMPSGDRLEAMGRDGERIRLWETPEALNWPRLSPDARRLAFQRVDGLRNNPDIWVEDLERHARTRITTTPISDIQPVWSPDGRQLAYVSGALPGRPGRRVLSIAAADGTGVRRTFPCPADYCEPTDWSADGRALLVNGRNAKGWDVWTVSPDGVGPNQQLLGEAFSERDARFSPNGQWIVYASGESGRSEVSVRSLSSPSTRIVLSAKGGDQPVWRRDGGEVLFVQPDGHLQSVRVQWSRTGIPTFSLATQLAVRPIGFGHWGTQYDISADGARIYGLRGNEDPAPNDIHVVIGWRALLDADGVLH